jgi:hypothetical protein
MREHYQDNEKQNPLQKILSKGSFYIDQRNNARNQIWLLLFTRKRGGVLTFRVISNSVVKDMARVVNGKGENSNNNHTAASTCHPLPGRDGIGDADQDSKTIKGIFWCWQVVVPAATKLDHTIDASSEDGDEGDSGHDQEPLEARAGAEVGEGGIEHLHHSGRADHEGETQNGKNGESENLEDETRKHEVVSEIEHLLVVGCRRDANAGTLQRERHNVTGEDDSGVPDSSDQGYILAVDVDTAQYQCRY